MALNVDVQVITGPGTTGNQTYNLPVNFGVKALFGFAAARTGDGAFAGTAGDPLVMSFGACTYRGGSVQQWYCTVAGEGGVQTAAHYANGLNDTGFLKCYEGSVDTNPPSITGFHLSLVSFGLQGGSTELDTFTLNFVSVDLDGATQFVIIAFGGDQVTDAIADIELTTATATQDWSFGFQPDLCIFGYASCPAGDFGGTNAAAHPHQSLGIARSDTDRRCSALVGQDAAGTMVVGFWQKARAILGMTSAAAAECEGDLSAKASWPSDGIQITWTDQPVANDVIGGLFLKGTFQSALGATVAPTATGNQDNNAGFTPKAALLWGGHMPSSASIQTGDSGTALLGGFMIGAMDGTDEGAVGWSEDDGNLNSEPIVYQEMDAAYTIYDADAQTLRVRADGSFSGNNVRLNFTNVAATDPPEYNWLALGDGAVAAARAIPPKRRVMHLLRR